MNIVRQTYLIRAPMTEVWQALVNPDYIEGWGAGPAVMDDAIGTEFQLWGGDIHGKNIEVVPEKLLQQEWYAGNWTEPSIATFHLFQEEGRVRLDFRHENLPPKELKDIEQGWKEYYLGPMKEYLEGKN